MIFSNKAKEEFEVESISSATMDSFIQKCANIYQGKPYWLSDDEDIKTVNMAKAICSEVARLTTLATSIVIDGSKRAEWLQQQIDNIYYQFRQWVEYGCAYGTIILKPNGESIDLVLPSDYEITEQKNGKITGAVFINRATSTNGKIFYTRLEYHRFINDVYVISNRCYEGYTANDLYKPIPIEDTPWSMLKDEVGVANLDRPLFSVLKTPSANNIDVDSPMGMPVFADAIEELKDLDIAYSRNVNEIFDSARMVLMDSDRLLPVQGGLNEQVSGWDRVRQRMHLPRYVRNVFGDGQNAFYQEINPNLETDKRLEGINSLLSQIGYKVGFANGYFVFNESKGITTATQIEADQQRTVQFIKDMRDQFQSCIDGLIYALDKFADLYSLAPVGKYEVTYGFGDILYNYEEDKLRWWGYVQSGKIPFWYYLTKFEDMSEEDAKLLAEEAVPKEMGLFSE